MSRCWERRMRQRQEDYTHSDKHYLFIWRSRKASCRNHNSRRTRRVLLLSAKNRNLRLSECYSMPLWARFTILYTANTIMHQNTTIQVISKSGELRVLQWPPQSPGLNPLQFEMRHASTLTWTQVFDIQFSILGLLKRKASTGALLGVLLLTEV